MANPKTLLLLDLARLPEPKASTYAWFALTISASRDVMSTSAECLELLQPWLWTPERRDALTVEVFGASDGDSDFEYVTSVSAEAYCPPSGGGPPDIDALKTQLENLLATLLHRDRHRLVHDPRSEMPEQNRWSHVLLEASRLPAPIGQHLNLVLVFKLTKTQLDLYDQLAVAPRFVAAKQLWNPDSVERPRPNDGHALLSVVYTDTRRRAGRSGSPPRGRGRRRERVAPVVDLLGLTAPLAYTPAAPPTLWLSGPASSGKNWFAQLPEEAADAGDLALRLSEAVDTTAQSAQLQLLTKDETSWLRRAALVALRFSAHSGWVAEDDQDREEGARRRPRPRLATEVAERLFSETTLRQAFLDAVGDYEAEYALISADPPRDGAAAEPYHHWASQLRNALDGQAPAWLLEAVEPANETDPTLFDPASEAVVLGDEVDAIRRLTIALREPDRLANLVIGHWKDAVTSGGAAQSVKDEILARLRNADLAAELAAGGLVARLTLDQLDSVWVEMTKAPRAERANEVPEMRERFREEYLKLVKNRLSADERSPGLRTEVWKGIVTRLFELKDMLGPEDSKAGDEELGPTGETRTAHPLVLTLPGLTTEAPGKVGEDSSDAARLAGFALLARQQISADGDKVTTYGDWHCLNMAQLSLAGPDEQRDTALLSIGLAPWRVAEAGGLEGWTVAYDNHPLTARSLAHALTNGVDDQTVDMKLVGADDDIVSLLTRLDQVEPDENDPLTLLPALKFGHRYEVVAFGVTNAGALPAELWGKDANRLCPLTLALPDGGLGYAVPVRYMRRTAVGAPRLLASTPDANGMDLPFQLPAIPPEHVFPLADDLLRSVTTPDKETEDIDDPATDGGPILLLAAPGEPWDPRLVRSEFEFGVRPPAVDLQVWHRWVAKDVDQENTEWSKGRIAMVFADYFRKAERPINDDGDPGSDQPRADLSLDDPAVEKLRFRLLGLSLGPDGVMTETVIATVDRPVVRPYAAPGLKGTQAPALRVEVKVAETAGLSSAVDTGPVNVMVAAGAAYRLEMAALVATRFYLPNDTARFRSPTSPLAVSGWVVASRAMVTIEAAAQLALQPENLWTSIRVLGRRGDELVIGIDPGRTDSFTAVKPVTLESQQWRWSGRRILRHFPYQDVMTWDDSVVAQQPTWDTWKLIQEWDGSGFGDRPDANRHIRAGILPSPPWKTSGTDTPGVGLTRGAPLLSLDLATEQGSLYLRCRATATSRYLGLMTTSGSEQATVRCSWRRFVVKNRRNERLPRPKVRFILPLTQPIEAPPAEESIHVPPVSPLIVLLEETWGETAGLVERLECQLMDATYGRPEPKGALKIPERWPEYGFDPIERGAVALAKPDGGKLPIEWDTERTPSFTTDSPPFGLTFDVGASQARPATSCFEIVMKDGTQAGVLRPGAFAKLRFQKTVDSYGSVLGAKAATASEWTDPYWVQLLPDSTSWRVKAAEGQDQFVRIDQLRVTRGAAIVRLGNETPRVLLAEEPPAESSLRRSLLLLLTRVIREADGYRVSEVPLSLGRFEPEQSVPTWQTGVSLTPESAFRVRLLEVEYHALRIPQQGVPDLFDRNAGDIGAQGVWHAVFGDAVPDRYRARFGRISPPIETYDSPGQ